MKDLMNDYPKIIQQYEKLLMTVNHAQRKEHDPNRIEYLEWLRHQLEAIAIDESR